MDYYAESNKGCLRELNEDNYCCGTSHGGSYCYFAVADGMGGYNAGEVASKTAINLFCERMPFAEETETKTTGKFLTEIIEKANRRILNIGDNNPETKGMGTTAVMGILSKENVLTLANAGDSRAYLLSGGSLSRLTRDHTYVENLVDCGVITREQAENHPNKNVVTKALGIEETVDPDIFTYELKSGDMIILCSDGLYDMVKDNEIKEIADKYFHDVKEVCRKLVESALKAGGADNVTVFVGRI